MKKELLLLVIISFLFSCANQKIEVNTHKKTDEIRPLSNIEQREKSFSDFRKIVPRNSVLVSFPKTPKSEKKILSLNGIDYWGEFSLKVNTRKKRYFVFMAFTNPRKFNDVETRILWYERILGCCFYSKVEIDRDSFNLHEIKNDFMIDKKLSRVLQNDSVYYSINGYDYKTIHEFEGKGYLSSRVKEDMIYSDDEIIPIFHGRFSDKKLNGKLEELTKEDGKSRPNLENNLFIGAIIYDIEISEVRKILKSKLLAQYITFGYPERITQKECIDSYIENH